MIYWLNLQQNKGIKEKVEIAAAKKQRKHDTNRFTIESLSTEIISFEIQPNIQNKLSQEQSFFSNLLELHPEIELLQNTCNCKAGKF